MEMSSIYMAPHTCVHPQVFLFGRGGAPTLTAAPTGVVPDPSTLPHPLCHARPIHSLPRNVKQPRADGACDIEQSISHGVEYNVGPCVGSRVRSLWYAYTLAATSDKSSKAGPAMHCACMRQRTSPLLGGEVPPGKGTGTVMTQKSFTLCSQKAVSLFRASHVRDRETDRQKERERHTHIHTHTHTQREREPYPPTHAFM